MSDYDVISIQYMREAAALLLSLNRIHLSAPDGETESRFGWIKGSAT